MASLDRQWWVEEARLDVDTRVFGVTAGLGSGKTYGSCDWLYDRIALNRNAKFFAHAFPIHQKIRDSAIPTWQKFLSRAGRREGIDYEVITSPFPLLRFLRTGQELHFLSMQNPERIVAVEYGDAAVSEAGTTKWESIQLLRTRVRDSGSTTRQTLLEGVPQGMNEFAEQFDSDTQEGWLEVATRDYYNAAKRYRRFRLTSFDNPYLPEGYVQDLYDTFGSNPARIQSYVYGIFTAFTTGNCYNYLPQLHDMDNIEANPFRDILMTWDFNANSRLSWIVNQQVAFEGVGKDKFFRYVAIDEANQGFSQLRDCCAEFASKFLVEKYGQTTIKIYGDRSGHSGSHKTDKSDFDAVKNYLNLAGFKNVQICALKYNPLETMSVEALNRWFHKDLHRVCRRCRLYRRSLASTSWKHDTRKIDKPQNDDWTDHSDAEKYLAYALQENEMRRVMSLNL